jgi:hypothetical protein
MGGAGRKIDLSAHRLYQQTDRCPIKFWRVTRNQPAGPVARGCRDGNRGSVVLEVISYAQDYKIPYPAHSTLLHLKRGCPLA